MQDSQLCYQIQMLQAFNMLKYDDFIINNKIESLYNSLRENEEIQKIINILSNKNSNADFFKAFQNFSGICVFQLLFSYEYFDVFHKCLAKYIINLKQDPDAEVILGFNDLENHVLENDL